MIKNFLNTEGHQNPISSLEVTAILLKGWILPIGGASAGEGLPCSLRSRLVLATFRALLATGGYDLAQWVDRESFSIETHLLSFIVGP